MLVMGGTLATEGIWPSAALASCPQNADKGIWVGSGSFTHGHGGRLNAVVKSENPGDCAAPGGWAAEGTAYEGVGGWSTGNWAEIGWLQYETGSGSTWLLFVEWGINGQITSDGGHGITFVSGCASPASTVTLRVAYTGSSNKWKMDYACNGGGFTTADTSDGLQFSTGQPNGEISHHSTNNATYYENFSALQRKSEMDVWSSGWGSWDCNQNTAPSQWNAHGDGSGTYTGFDDGLFSSGICP
jgi:hypothetical protein